MNFAFDKDKTKIKLNKIFNIVLIGSYIPLSVFGFLSYMGISGIIDETNENVVVLTKMACYIGLFMPAVVIASILISKILNDRGIVKCSLFVKTIPLILFVGMLVFGFIIEMIR